MLLAAFAADRGTASSLLQRLKVSKARTASFAFLGFFVYSRASSFFFRPPSLKRLLLKDTPPSPSLPTYMTLSNFLVRRVSNIKLRRTVFRV